MLLGGLKPDYFARLGSPDPGGSFGQLTSDISTDGCSASLGILASSDKRGGAWRFVRTYMEGEDNPFLSDGIPTRRDCFERAVEAELTKENPDYYGDIDLFNQGDAALLREAVYNADRLVWKNEALIDALQAELSSYLDGVETKEAAAAHIQSRVSCIIVNLS